MSSRRSGTRPGRPRLGRRANIAHLRRTRYRVAGRRGWSEVRRCPCGSSQALLSRDPTPVSSPPPPRPAMGFSPSREVKTYQRGIPMQWWPDGAHPAYAGQHTTWFAVAFVRGLHGGPFPDLSGTALPRGLQGRAPSSPWVLQALDRLHPEVLCSGGRGRDRDCSPPPAQTPACRTTALGSYLGCRASNRTLG